MPIDAKLYKQAREYYRQWNEAELKERIRNAGKISPEEAWEQYRDLWEFCVNLNKEAEQGQRIQKTRDLNVYYERMRWPFRLTSFKIKGKY